MSRRKMNKAVLLQFVGSLLKAAVIARGADLRVTREQVARAESEFDLRIEPADDGFVISLRATPEDAAPKLDLPPESPIWRPGQ